VWGFNQVVVKLALPEVGPIAQTGIRSAIGVVCVALYAVLAKRRIFLFDGSETAGWTEDPCEPRPPSAKLRPRLTYSRLPLLAGIGASFYPAMGALLLLARRLGDVCRNGGLAVAFLIAGALRGRVCFSGIEKTGSSGK